MTSSRQHDNAKHPVEFAWDNRTANVYTAKAHLDSKSQDKQAVIYEPAPPVPGDASGISYFFSR